MSRTIKYTDGEIGNINIVEDFLPSPEKLVFDEEEKKHHAQHQRRICNLQDLHVTKQIYIVRHK